MDSSPGGRRSVGLLFLFGFGSAAAYVVARTIAESAFLSHIGPEKLAELIMVSAGVVALSSLCYGNLVRRVGLRTVSFLTLGMLAATSAVMSPLLHALPGSLAAFAFAYLTAQVRGSLGTILYATLLNEQFANRGPESVVGVVGFGATLAGVTMGLTMGVLAERVDVEALMYLVFVIDLATMVPVMLLPTTDHSEPSAPTDAESATPAHALRDVIGSLYVRSIIGIVATGVLVVTLVEYQWKVAAAEQLRMNEQDLAAYFGYFYGGVYLATGLMQLFVTGRVLTRRGLLAGLIAFPAALLIATGAAVLASAQQMRLWTLTLMKGCDIFKRSMNDPSIQVLYSPLDPTLRPQAITFVAGVTKPTAEALAAIVLILLEHRVSFQGLCWIILALLIGWLAASNVCWRQFSKLRAKGHTELP